ncbi:MAG: NAC family transcription factor [Methanomicrobiales archaeon]|jgi:hypothetical protein
MADKEGTYCTICGGMVPDAVKIRRISVDGKEVGIDRLEEILDGVILLGLPEEARVKVELLSRVRAYNYVSSAKEEACGEALLGEYRTRLKMRG